MMALRHHARLIWYFGCLFFFTLFFIFWWELEFALPIGLIVLGRQLLDASQRRCVPHPSHPLRR